MSPELRISRRTLINAAILGGAAFFIPDSRANPRAERKYTTTADITTYLSEMEARLGQNSHILAQRSYPDNVTTSTTYTAPQRSIVFTSLFDESLSNVVITSTDQDKTTSITFQEFMGTWNIFVGDGTELQMFTSARLPERDFVPIQQQCQQVVDSFIK